MHAAIIAFGAWILGWHPARVSTLLTRSSQAPLGNPLRHPANVYITGGESAV